MANTEDHTQDLRVKIDGLKESRTKLKLRITNASKRLCQAINDNVGCNDVMLELQASLNDFNSVHLEYCLLIECNEEFNNYRVVNGLDLEAYQATINNVFYEAKVKYETFMASKEAEKIKWHITLQSTRLAGICDSVDKMFSDSSNIDLTMMSCYKEEIEKMNDDLLHGMTLLSAIDSSCAEEIKEKLSKLIVRSDDIITQCKVKQKLTHLPSHGTSMQSINIAGPMLDSKSNVSSAAHAPSEKVSELGYREVQSENVNEGKGNDATGISQNSTIPLLVNNNTSFQSSQPSLVQTPPQIIKSERPACDIYLKKTSLPEFSGLRRDWPEFKAVWRELAESNIRSQAVLAYELKRCLKGQAKERVQNIYITKPEAYELIWKRLCDYYDDVGASVQAALDGLARIKHVRDDDFKGLVSLIDSVEAAFAQLEELGQTEVISMRDIDRITDLLPNNLKMMWIRQYHQLESQMKLKPLPKFMEFLSTERAAVSRLAESKKSSVGQTNFARGTSERPKHDGNKGVNCAVHKEKAKHRTAECRDFQKLSLDDKYGILKNVHACFNCLGLHRRDKCTSKATCKTCGKVGHHFLLCRSNSTQGASATKDSSPLNFDQAATSVSSNSNVARDPGSQSLYAIHEVFVTNCGKTATVFCDNGSNTTYITHSAADRLYAKKLDRYTLGVTTMGNVDTEYETRLYEITVRTLSGKVVPILAFGMDEITGPVAKLDEKCVAHLFPDHDVSLLQPKSRKVDLLIGCDYFGLHAKQEVARAGEHLSIMHGELGSCIQGYHPNIRESTRYSANMIKTLHEYKIRTDCYFVQHRTHPEFCFPYLNVKNEKVASTACTMFNKAKTDEMNFFHGEDLVTETNPRCGSCKCGKCPIVGHSYSFREEQELVMIRNNLNYDEINKCWITSYPWIIDPATLPDNYHVALATLTSTERTLAKDPDWALKYNAQIQDMVDRNVARKLSSDELKTWSGPTFYISHLAVQNPSSKSTPVRIVFNSSQVCGGISLNTALAKGPDSYINNLMGLLLRWREQEVAFAGDIKKMFNSVHLELAEQHCHRFLWRGLKTEHAPDIYVMTRVNMGDRPAPAISTEALYKTAERFHADSPAAAKILRTSSYVDDLIDSVADLSTALKVTGDVENMLAKGGFTIKCWQYSGESGARSTSKTPAEVSLLKGTDGTTRVLGVMWNPAEDTILYKTVLNFSKKRKGVRTGQCLNLNDLPDSIPDILTRRLVLEQVMSIFDPLGFLCPFTLLAKLYLRETWSMQLGWDDALPANLRAKWIAFFTSLFHIEAICYPRCLRPVDAIGQPWLVILSDGSDLAYGFAAYIRWERSDGSFWCRLIFAKCRIAPINRLSTPQMELNAAVLSKRGRKVIESEMRFSFQKVLHIVDSETVLGMIKKTSTKFKVYEGVRIGEIQAATNGDVSEWAWMSGKKNTADWLTRGKTPCELDQHSEWWKGPAIFCQPESTWGLKFSVSKDEPLPGEKKLSSCVTHATRAQVPSLIDYSRFSAIRRVYWVIARLISIGRSKSFKGGKSSNICPELLQEAEQFVIKDVQNSMIVELSKVSKQGAIGGKFSALKPYQDATGLWSVGTRLAHCNPMTPDSSPQRLLAYDHAATRLIMRDAHESGHRGRNGTLAKFREKFWTPNGSKMAWQAKNHCQLCKLRNCKLLEQSMGQLPEARLKPSPPFCYSMVDFFGPYLIRGEVQKRTSGKSYGVIFTDLTMRAVHIEPVFGYDTGSFLMALTRFVSIRGWPSVMYSDPGTQFVAADKEIKKMWEKLDRSAIIRRSSENGLKWIMGAADSPWQQGAAESMVKAAKRAIAYSIHNQRLSASEFITLCAEVTNIINERPIGTIPTDDSDINILTPNSLLLGRASAKNPGGWQPLSVSSYARYQLVQQVADHFWKKWVELCAPSLVVQRKWHKSSRSLQEGDVVLILDKNTLRSEYRIGIIKQVFPGNDGKIRKVSVAYKNHKIGEKVCKYSGAKDTVVTRSIQRLALLVPIADD